MFAIYRGYGWIFKVTNIVNQWARKLNKDQPKEVHKTIVQFVFEKQVDNFKPMLYE